MNCAARLVGQPVTRCAPTISTGNTITVRSKKIRTRSTGPIGKLERRIITPTSDMKMSWQTDRPASTKLVALLSMPDAVMAGMY